MDDFKIKFSGQKYRAEIAPDIHFYVVMLLAFGEDVEDVDASL